jgi:hypothetical protein
MSDHDDQAIDLTKPIEVSAEATLKLDRKAYDLLVAASRPVFAGEVIGGPHDGLRVVYDPTEQP